MASLADTGAYLDQLYQEKFGRAPDAAGKAYWKAELDSGKTSADQVAALFDSSDEAKQIKADEEEETRQFIEDTYKIELDREPDNAGADYWAEQINTGKQTQQEVVDNFRRSNEYQNINDTEGAGLNDEEWLQETYQEELDRDLGDEGREYWLGDLGEGATREEVKNNIKASNEKWLGDIYEEDLGRKLGDEGRDYWLDDIKGGQTREQVRDNIRRSDEYACAQSGGTWNGSSCNTDIVCGSGQQLNSAGDGCIDIPEIPDDVCPTGTRKNAAGNCEAIPGPCPSGETRNAAGDCEEPEIVMDPGHSEPEIKEPEDKEEEEGREDGGTGEVDPDDGGTGKDYETALDDYKEKYAKVKSDYDDARREADSYINAQRADETSQLTRGFNVGSFPGRRRGDLTSGATATSDRSRKRSRITAGPRVKEDRPYAKAGLRSGDERGSTYFDSGSSFR